MFINAGRLVKKGVPVGGVIAGLLFCFTGSLSAKQVGKFMYRGAPEDYITPKFNGTVTVSDTMVAMAEKIRVINKFIADSILDTPSIFFIIDNSNSMSNFNAGNPVNDAPGNRFRVTSAFIDTIYKRFPSAEIGYAVFQELLFFRAGDNALFQAYSASDDPGGAYLPLRKLNGNFGGQTGLAIAKRFLETKMVSSSMGGPQYADLTYTPSTMLGGGTNINVGFNAAKEAFLKTMQKEKECHYVIFLSDGDANFGMPDPDEFVQGKNVPTTFTIYFTPNNQVPQNIVNMTTNIRNNGYSLSNQKSKYWPYSNTDFDKLMNFLMENIFGMIFSSKPALPISITMTGQTMNAWNQGDSTFAFKDLFPLTGIVTPFQYLIKYPVKGGGDTTSIINFNVKQQTGLVMPPADFEVKLWDRDIVFRYNNVPIALATEAMNQIELTFPWNGGTADYKYTNVTIELSTVVPPTDRETVSLTAGSTIFTAFFTRATSDVRTPGNAILEHARNGDSIVAVFRNSQAPKLPLDTLRVALPVAITVFPILTSAITNDLNGNGFLDHIVISFSKAAPIATNAGSSFTVQCNGITFPVDSIVKLNDSTYSLCLKEQTQNYVPQTSWKPAIGISGLNGIADIAGFIAVDGAPPVVWTVVKQVVSLDNHTTDIVTVTLSEKVNGTGGAPFGAANLPYQTFFVWNKNGAAFTAIDTMLAGIIKFTAVLSDSILLFTMSNNHDLNESHWMNIQSLPKLLCDKAGNFPTEVNQKVKVKVLNPPDPPISIHAVPNPSGPTSKQVPPGVFNFQHEPNALNWVYNDNAGVVISIKNVQIPPVELGFWKAYIKIYDVAGNPVAWDVKGSDKIFQKIPSPGSSVKELNIYWNGFNKSGTSVAPGVYRAVVLFDYPMGYEQKGVKLHVKVGIRPAG